jgi:hypothetical protein
MEDVKFHYTTYVIPSLVSNVFGGGLILGRSVLHSTVQYTTKRAVLDGSCPSVPINVSTLCPASLGSVLMGEFGGMDMTG